MSKVRKGIVIGAHLLKTSHGAHKAQTPCLTPEKITQG